MGERVSRGASRRQLPSCRVEVHVRRGGGGGGTGTGDGGSGGGGGGEGVGEDAHRHGRAAGLRDHGAGDPEALLLVRFEHVGEAEALAAHVAGVRLLPRVGAPVALHVGPAGEALPADLTDERLLSCGDSESIRREREADGNSRPKGGARSSNEMVRRSFINRLNPPFQKKEAYFSISPFLHKQRQFFQKCEYVGSLN